MLGSLAATLDWAVDCGLGGLATILSTSVVCGCLLLSVVAEVQLTGRGTSLICTLFHLRTPFGVFTKYERGVSALNRTSPETDLFLVWGSCSLTGCVGRRCGSYLVGWILTVIRPGLHLSHPQHICGTHSLWSALVF